MGYFDGIIDKKAIKKRYRVLALEHHPDRGGDVAVMQEINAEFKAALSDRPSILSGIAEAFKGRGYDFSSQMMQNQMEAMRRQQEEMARNYMNQGYQQAMNYFNQYANTDYSKLWQENYSQYANIWKER